MIRTQIFQMCWQTALDIFDGDFGDALKGVLWLLLPLIIISMSWIEGIQRYRQFYYETPAELAVRTKTIESFLHHADGANSQDLSVDNLLNLLEKHRNVDITIQVSGELAGPNNIQYATNRIHIDLMQLVYLSGAQNLSIVLDVDGKALGDYYKDKNVNSRARFFYTGARLSGTIALKTEDGHVLASKGFRHKTDPAWGWSTRSKGGTVTRSDRPIIFFDEYKAMYIAILKAFGEIYEMEYLAYYDKSLGTRINGTMKNAMSDAIKQTFVKK